VLFAAVALGLRTPAQMWRLVGAVVLAGTLAALVGIAQHWGLSPFGISGTAGNRVTGPAGNPIFLGALLVLTLPLALGAVSAWAVRRGTPAWWWAGAGVLAFVHLFALVLTIARGPWLGTAFAMAVLLVLAWMRLGAGLAARLAVVTGASAGAAILALSIPVGGARAPVDEPAAVMDSAAPVTQAAAPATQSTAVAYEEIGARLEGSSIAAGVSGRRTRWETSLRLLRDRPDLPLGSNRPWAVRSLVGYGPDSFRYAFPLEAPAALSTVLTTAAHNDPLTRAVELGLLGFIAYAALAAAAVAVLVSRFRLGAAGNVEAALLTGVAAALVGRFVEQQVGIAQVSDTLVFWLLMGLLAAAPAALAAPGAGQSRAAPPASASHALGLLAVSGVAALAIGVALLTWVKNVGYLQADHAASSARVLFGRDSGAALEVVERAISMAPDVPGYRHLKASMLRSVAAATTDPLRARTLIVEAYGSDREAFELNPFSRQASFILADSAWGLAQAGFPQGAVEALEAYERLARLSPQDPLVWDRLGRLYDALDVDPALRLAPH
ncbi:MAG: O-antigen ligase family protein, partial [Gemmatimonadetes bacterium]|nr:O-antigen ligase family protein [Gemmatimonadota bacterium]